MNTYVVLMVLAIVLFVLASVAPVVSPVALMPLGLALTCLAQLAHQRRP